MSRSALAEAAGVTRQTICAIKKGRYAPSLETGCRIARAFGIAIEDVFGWEDNAAVSSS